MHLPRRRRLLASLAVIAGAGAVASFGIYGAFSAETVNSGNEFSSAELELTSSNATSTEPVYFKTNAVPGDSGDTDHSCIEITYTGTVPAEVRLYGDTIAAGTGLAPGILLKITEGDGGTEDACATFVASGTEGDVLGGTDGETLQHIRNFIFDYDAGLLLGTWSPGESRVYRFESWLDEGVDPETTQGLNAGNQAFVWEARAGD